MNSKVKNIVLNCVRTCLRLILPLRGRHDPQIQGIQCNQQNLAGPLGYQGSKAAMRVISEADVVLAVGTR